MITLEDLIEEGEKVLESKWAYRFDFYVDDDKYEVWRRKSQERRDRYLFQIE